MAKKATQRHGYKTGEFVVYPAHGVGQIVEIEEQEIAGTKLELFVIDFQKDKMKLRVPTSKIESVNMRKLADDPTVERALKTVQGRARVKRTMWSRRARRNTTPRSTRATSSRSRRWCATCSAPTTQPEQSYSERQLYEAALERMAREIAAVKKLTETEAVHEIEANLAKGPRRGPKPEGEEDDEVETEAGEEAKPDEAAA